MKASPHCHYISPLTRGQLAQRAFKSSTKHSRRGLLETLNELINSQCVDDHMYWRKVFFLNKLTLDGRLESPAPDVSDGATLSSSNTDRRTIRKHVPQDDASAQAAEVRIRTKNIQKHREITRWSDVKWKCKWTWKVHEKIEIKKEIHTYRQTEREQKKGERDGKRVKGKERHRVSNANSVLWHTLSQRECVGRMVK